MARNLLVNYVNRFALEKTGLLPVRRLVPYFLKFSTQTVKDEEIIKENPYYSKYEDKIETMKKDQPEDYISRLKSYEKKDKVPQAAKDGKRKGDKKEASKPLRSTLMESKTFSDIVKLELLESKTAAEIQHIWNEFHKNVDGLSSVLPGDVFERFIERSKLYPIFLLPLPRKEGYEFMVCQFNKYDVHFTPLISWQSHKENAAICMSVSYYSDLVKSKGIAPMRGAYDKKVLSHLEAQCLANSLHLYYADESPRRTALLEKFTNDPENFKHMDLIAEVESFSKGR